MRAVRRRSEWTDRGCGVRLSLVAQTDSAVVAEVCLSAVDCVATRTLHRQLDAAHITEVSARWITVPARRQETVQNATVFFVHDDAPLLARLHEKARSSVLAPAPFAVLGTVRPFFSIAQDGDAARVNTLCNEMIHVSGYLPRIRQVGFECRHAS